MNNMSTNMSTNMSNSIENFYDKSYLLSLVNSLGDAYNCIRTTDSISKYEQSLKTVADLIIKIYDACEHFFDDCFTKIKRQERYHTLV